VLVGRLLQLGDRAARTGDLVTGAARERVRAHRQRDAEVAVAEHLHRLVAPDGAGLDELLRTHRTALGEQRAEVADVHDLVLHPETVAEALELGQPHVQRHLPALEAGRDVLASARALRTAAGGLAALAALATADAPLGLVGPRRRTQVVDLDRHQDTSSTVTRCRTVRIMPRICGVSSRSTDWRILRRPRESSVARWFCLPPIVLRTWVIFSVATGSPRTLR